MSTAKVWALSPWAHAAHLQRHMVAPLPTIAHGSAVLLKIPRDILLVPPAVLPQLRCGALPNKGVQVGCSAAPFHSRLSAQTGLPMHPRSNFPNTGSAAAAEASILSLEGSMQEQHACATRLCC
jgi:hypothetical protein